MFQFHIFSPLLDSRNFIVWLILQPYNVQNFTLPHPTQISQCPLSCIQLQAKLDYSLAISGTFPKLFFLSTFIQTISSFSNAFLSCLCLSKFFPSVIYFLHKVAWLYFHTWRWPLSLFNFSRTKSVLFFKILCYISQHIHFTPLSYLPLDFHFLYGRINVWFIFIIFIYSSSSKCSLSKY